MILLQHIDRVAPHPLYRRLIAGYVIGCVEGLEPKGVLDLKQAFIDQALCLPQFHVEDPIIGY
jgi:hypothetical protein